MNLPILYRELELRVKDLTLDMIADHEKRMFLLAKNKQIFKYNKN